MSSTPINIIYLLGIPPDDLTHIESAVTTLRTKFLPRLADLNADQIRALTKFGSASTDFSDKTYAHVAANPGMKASCIDMDIYTQIVADYGTLGDIMRDLAPVFNQGNDSLMLLGSEKYSYDLASYTNFQLSQRMNVPGADLIVADLAPRFAGQGRTVKAAARKAKSAVKTEEPGDAK